MPIYSSTDVKRHFCALLKRAETGEEVIISRRGKQMVRLQPLTGKDELAPKG